MGIKAKVFSRQSSNSTPPTPTERQEQTQRTPPSPSYSAGCSSHASSCTAAETSPEKDRERGGQDRHSENRKSRLSTQSTVPTDETSSGTVVFNEGFAAETCQPHAPAAAAIEKGTLVGGRGGIGVTEATATERLFSATDIRKGAESTEEEFTESANQTPPPPPPPPPAVAVAPPQLSAIVTPPRPPERELVPLSPSSRPREEEEQQQQQQEEEEEQQQFWSQGSSTNGSSAGRRPEPALPCDEDQSNNPPSSVAANDNLQADFPPQLQQSPPPSPPPKSLRPHPQLHLLTSLPSPLASVSTSSTVAAPTVAAAAVAPSAPATPRTLPADRAVVAVVPAATFPVGAEPLLLPHTSASTTPKPGSAPARAPPPPPLSSSSIFSPAAEPHFTSPTPQLPSASYLRRPSQVYRRQSLFPAGETHFINTLLRSEALPVPEESESDYRTDSRNLPASYQLPSPSAYGAVMVNRKIWVKRQGGSPTMVNVHEEDMVDDVRDVVLRKYQNALARSFDAPDISLRIIPRGGQSRPRSLDHALSHGHGQPLVERLLNPDEPVARTLDEYFPGGQTAEEALVIEVPQRRTPRPSPSHAHTYPYSPPAPDAQSVSEVSEYFPPMPPMSSGHSQTPPALSTQAVSSLVGPAPAPASPGHRKQHRPPMARRMPTSSPNLHPSGTAGTNGGPVVLATRKSRSRVNSDASTSQPTPPPPPVPTPPTETPPQKSSTPPPPRVASPLTKKYKKEKKHASPAGLLPDGAVPPINVLIVEDNVINLRLLEAFMKRLKVRWQSAMNGKDAVKKWRAGGFHLVLMDIQLPVMNGLEATKEIRRLERINSIGAFSQSTSPSEEEAPTVSSEEDKLPNSILFKSPVIIVALTASSLQSDRNEALAAGCNDFLTKPVNFIWLERKVTEWGCMQALIDFDGWRKWKDYTNTEGLASAEGKVIKPHQRMLATGNGKNNSSEHDGKRAEENGTAKFSIS
ncbi:Two-component response regulator SSK1p [Rhizina undulata]